MKPIALITAGIAVFLVGMAVAPSKVVMKTIPGETVTVEVPGKPVSIHSPDDAARIGELEAKLARANERAEELWKQGWKLGWERGYADAESQKARQRPEAVANTAEVPPYEAAVPSVVSQRRGLFRGRRR